MLCLVSDSDYFEGFGIFGADDPDPRPALLPSEASQQQQPSSFPVMPDDVASRMVSSSEVPVTSSAAPSSLAPSAIDSMVASSTLAPDRRSAAVTFLVAAAGTGAGYALGGAYGAGAGLLAVGATRNMLRAKSFWRKSDAEHAEAVKSGTMALFGFGIGGFLAYKAYQSKGEG